jgi:UDP-N-acetylglucosamine 2-epimerase
MGNKRKICVVTGSRADYGLLYWLMQDIKTSNLFELQLVVTGMHLSPEFGSTGTCREPIVQRHVCCCNKVGWTGRDRFC